MVTLFELILGIVVIIGVILLCSMSTYSFRMRMDRKDHPPPQDVYHVVVNMWNYIRQSKPEPTLSKTKQEYEDFKSSYSSAEEVRYRGGAAAPRESDNF
jgi:hypothetical protein